MKLVVVTPVSRYQNLPAILQSVEANAPDCTWMIYYDLGKRGFPAAEYAWAPETTLSLLERTFRAGQGWGHEARNKALEEIPSDAWIYWLDDDNLLHPELVPTARDWSEQMPDCRAMVFEQERPDVCPAMIAACHTDMGQVLVRRDALADFQFDVLKREADADMVLWLEERLEWSYVHVPCTFYNRLAW